MPNISRPKDLVWHTLFTLISWVIFIYALSKQIKSVKVFLNIFQNFLRNHIVYNAPDKTPKGLVNVGSFSRTKAKELSQKATCIKPWKQTLVIMMRPQSWAGYKSKDSELFKLYKLHLQACTTSTWLHKIHLQAWTTSRAYMIVQVTFGNLHNKHMIVQVTFASFHNKYMTEQVTFARLYTNYMTVQVTLSSLYTNYINVQHL